MIHGQKNVKKIYVFVHLSVTHNKIFISVIMATGFCSKIDPLSLQCTRRVKVGSLHVVMTEISTGTSKGALPIRLCRWRVLKLQYSFYTHF